MSIVAFIVIAFMLTVYVLLDGYDLGVAAIAPLVARNESERRACMQAIGPFWNGNEVWLVAAGGALFALFPQAYASSFSGFYLPFMIVLWLLMGRGVALELRDHFPSALWKQFWDAVFALSSLLLIVLFGVAVGNLVRGVPLDADGYFDGTFAFLLNGYALLAAVFVAVALALHGAVFLMWRVEGPLSERSRALARTLGVVALVLFVLTSIATAFVHGPVPAMVYALAVLALLGVARLVFDVARGNGGLAFAGSCVWLALLMVVVAGTLFPYLIPAFPRGSNGISIYTAAPSPTALVSALTVTIVGIVAVCIYSIVVWRKLAGKVHS